MTPARPESGVPCADEAQLSPLQVGVFMSVIAVSGLAVSAWLGRRHDRSASRAPAFIALAAPAVGYLALTTTTRYDLLLIAAGFLGAGMAAFPQLFTPGHRPGDRAVRQHPHDRFADLRNVRGDPSAPLSAAEPTRPSSAGR